MTTYYLPLLAIIALILNSGLQAQSSIPMEDLQVLMAKERALVAQYYEISKPTGASFIVVTDDRPILDLEDSPAFAQPFPSEIHEQIRTLQQEIELARRQVKVQEEKKTFESALQGRTQHDKRVVKPF